MHRRLAVLLTATLAVAAGASAAPATAHQSGCHANYSCPSDHHTYVWVDPSTGESWDCAASYAPEYNPVIDTQGFYDSISGMQWYCHLAYGSPPTPPPPPAPVAPSPPPPDLFLTATQAKSYLRKLVRQNTHPALVGLHAHCSRLSSQKFRCQPDWRDSRNAYAGTATIWTYESGGQGYWDGRFRGLKASLSCLARRSARACARRVSF
jgi:hypothetical protein